MSEIRKFLLMLFVAAVPLGMIACSSDDDDPNDDDGDNTSEFILADEAKGSYIGTYTVTNLDNLRGDMDVVFVKTGDDEVKINLSSLAIPIEESDEDITVTFHPIEKIKLTGETKDITIASQAWTGDLGVSGNIHRSASITVAGAIEDKDYLSMTLTVVSGLLDKWVEGGKLEVSIVAEKE